VYNLVAQFVTFCCSVC